MLTLAGREEHATIAAVETAEGFLVVGVLVGNVVWQESKGTKVVILKALAKSIRRLFFEL